MAPTPRKNSLGLLKRELSLLKDFSRANFSLQAEPRCRGRWPQNVNDLETEQIKQPYHYAHPQHKRGLHHYGKPHPLSRRKEGGTGHTKAKVSWTMHTRDSHGLIGSRASPPGKRPKETGKASLTHQDLGREGLTGPQPQERGSLSGLGNTQRLYTASSLPAACTRRSLYNPPPGGMNTQVHIPQKGHEHYKQEDQDSLSQEPKQLLAVHHRQRDSVADRRHMHCRGKGLTARIKSIKTVT